MRERSLVIPRPSVRTLTAAIDVVLLTPRDHNLAILLLRADPRARDRWLLPWDAPRNEEAPDDAALRVAKSALGTAPTALEQIGTFGDGRRHPGDARLSVSFFGLVPQGSAAPPLLDGAAWVESHQMPPLAPRHRAIAEAALDVLRRRIDQSPLAFRLLPPSFTLSDLQAIYELLLGRPLHKASFRRALQAAFLVEPTDEWRSEGRGRPAQLYRYAPRRKRAARRGVRFDLLESSV